MTENIKFGTHPEDFKRYTTQEIRERYLIEEVMKAGEVTCTYSMHDRLCVMGVVPTKSPIELPAMESLTKASYFLERRELGIINIGPAGKVSVDGQSFELANKECLYVGMGAKSVVFESADAAQPAEFYLCSTPAHRAYPTTKAVLEDANQVHLGAGETSNKRTIFQFIHEGGIQSCQLVMGYTTLHEGNVWNTFPPHTHLRRMEAYFYIDVPQDQIVMHFMGEPQETRHVKMHNKQAIISPEWSIHSGAGTAAYSFIWAMGGENKAFTDMDGAPYEEIM